jgi:hypothetical protein
MRGERHGNTKSIYVPPLCANQMNLSGNLTQNLLTVTYTDFYFDDVIFAGIGNRFTFYRVYVQYLHLPEGTV